MQIGPGNLGDPRSRMEATTVEFLVEFEVCVPDRPESLVRLDNRDALTEAVLADAGHLVRVWRRPMAWGEPNVLGLYRVADEEHLDELLRHLSHDDRMHITVTPLEPHPCDPGAASPGRSTGRLQSI